MDLYTQILDASTNPGKLEELYTMARSRHMIAEFKIAVEKAFQETPSNLLLEAWKYRLETEGTESFVQPRFFLNWRAIIPFGLVNGLLLWLLSGELFAFNQNNIPFPYLALLAAPIVGVTSVIFLSMQQKSERRRAVWFGLAMLTTGLYTFLRAPGFQHYRELMILIVPLLCWIGGGLYLLGFKPSPRSLFAFLIKSVEVLVTGGVFMIGAMVFTGITLSLFSTLNITPSNVLVRLLIFTLGGFIPPLAISLAYDPGLHPGDQDFSRDLSRMTITFPRFLIPITIIVALIYLSFLPFNFMAPFNNRDVLIINNVLLFAVMGLLIGSTPRMEENLSEQNQRRLRLGIIIIAILVTVVSLHAISATIYRTVLGGLTLNRTTIIGWNIINITLLILLQVKQFKGGLDRWISSLHEVFHLGGKAYLVWALFLLLIAPWLFQI